MGDIHSSTRRWMNMLEEITQAKRTTERQRRLARKRIYVLKKDTVFWKKAYARGDGDWLGDRAVWNVVVKLLVPKGARIHIPFFIPKPHLRPVKLRVSKAKVVGYYRAVMGKRQPVSARSLASKGLWVSGTHDWRFRYPKGKVVEPTRPFSETHKICAHGIHCFADFRSARDY